MPVHWIYYHRLKSPTNYGIIVLRRVDMWNNPITVSYCKIGESLMATRNNCVVADKKCINQTHFNFGLVVSIISERTRNYFALNLMFVLCISCRSLFKFLYKTKNK